MAVLTFGEIKDQVRQRADMQNLGVGSDDPFIGDLELGAYINNSLCDLYDTTAEANEDQRYDSEFVFQTVGNTDSYPLPDDFYKLNGVDANIAGFTYTLNQYPFAERNRFANLTAPGWIRGSRLYYRLRQDNIVFSPIPDGLYVVTLHYTPEFKLLVNLTDEVNFPNCWIEWVILDSAIKCLMKEESDTTFFELEKARCETRIRNLAPKRDDGAPQTVSDVTRQWELWLV